eukprot:XP_014011504.1 PREDICTED: transmembrane protein 256-like isoform X2 [Salmo salar]
MQRWPVFCLTVRPHHNPLQGKCYLCLLYQASEWHPASHCQIGFKNKDPEDYSIVLYETANKYHFYHSIALLGASRCRKPAVAGTLLVVGMGAFCGSLYHQALTENPVLRKLAPYGGMFLIAGWLAIAI